MVVPIQDPADTVIAAMNSSTHVSRGTAEDIVNGLLPHARKTEAAIEADRRVNA